MSRTAKGRSLSLTDADWSALKADAAREGLPVAAYVRRLWLAARPREVTAGAWGDLRGQGWRRAGDAAGAQASHRGWSAYCGSDHVLVLSDLGLSANRDAADAWLRSRGVVLA